MDEKYVQGEIGGTVTSPSKVRVVDPDYNNLENKPTINGVEVSGAKTLNDFGKLTAPNFTGEKATVSVKGTPSGKIALDLNSSAEDASTYTPSGDITVQTEKSTVKQMTNEGTLPTLTDHIEDGVLSFEWVQGTLPVAENAELVSSVSATFAGKQAKIAAIFNGEELTSTGDYTPHGINSAPEFTSENGG